jgi:hypothetical protein
MAARGLTVEAERRVGLVKVIMGTDLDWPVTGVGNFDGQYRATGVEFDVARGSHDFAWDHGEDVLVARS